MKGAWLDIEMSVLIVKKTLLILVAKNRLGVIESLYGLTWSSWAKYPLVMSVSVTWTELPSVSIKLGFFQFKMK